MREKLISEITAIPLIDIHTHLDATHLPARGLHDILLYHMIVSELYAAGCPDGERLSENPDEAECERRIVAALPYLPLISNTSLYYIMTCIVKDLYGWSKPLTLENWRQCDAKIREKYKQPGWAKEIFARANIEKAVTELWRNGDGSSDDLLVYSLEWAFFARSQYGRFDAPLLELENAWGQLEPGPPLAVSAGEINVKRTITCVADVKEALIAYCERIPYDKIVSTAHHISTDITFSAVTDEEMEQALKCRASAGKAEQDIYASYLFEAFLTEFEKKCGRVGLLFSIGAEPLPFETGSKLRTDTLFELAAIIHRHPGIHFQAMLGSAHQNQGMCTLARENPNLTLTGYWWHNFYPAFIEKLIAERLDMLPQNKQIAFFSDAYCADWMYGKAMLVRACVANVLAKKIEFGQYTHKQAVDIAQEILYRVSADFISGVQ